MNIRVKFFNIQLLMDFEIEEQTLHPYTSQTVLPHHSHFQLSRNTLYPPRYCQGLHCIQHRPNYFFSGALTLCFHMSQRKKAGQLVPVQLGC